MENEVKYSKYAETGQFTSRVTFDEFLKYYVNHRPVYGVEAEDIEKALEVSFRILDFFGFRLLRRTRTPHLEATAGPLSPRTF